MNEYITALLNAKDIYEAWMLSDEAEDIEFNEWLDEEIGRFTVEQ